MDEPIAYGEEQRSLGQLREALAGAVRSNPHSYSTHKWCLKSRNGACETQNLVCANDRSTELGVAGRTSSRSVDYAVDDDSADFRRTTDECEADIGEQMIR